MFLCLLLKMQTLMYKHKIHFYIIHFVYQQILDLF